MKRLVVVSVIVFSFLVSPCFAINYCKDVLETGNPGGATSSLKTWDEEWTIGATGQAEIDIWINNVPETLITAGFYLEYDDSQMNIVSVDLYDNSSLSGPWDSGFSNVIPDPDGPGTYFVAVGNFGTVAPDSEGDIVIGRLTISCVEGCALEITVKTIPDFDTVVGGDSDELFDTRINPNNVAIDQNTSETTTTTSILDDTDDDADDDADDDEGEGEDTDEDGISDDKDNCPEIPNGPEAGTCIFGDLAEPCFIRGGYPKQCGGNGWCSMEQEDLDGDGLGDVCDNCYAIPNGPALGICVNTLTGVAGEETCENNDDCGDEETCNNGQEDTDCDGIGDICDPSPNCREGINCDAECDGFYDQDDNCPQISNPEQEDEDSDGVGDVCDNCQETPNGPDLGTCVNTSTLEIAETCENDGDCDDGETCSKNQEDIDDDGKGDACDTDYPLIPLTVPTGYILESEDNPVDIILDNADNNVSFISFSLCDADNYLTCIGCETTGRTNNFTCESSEVGECCEVTLEKNGSDATVDGGSGPICIIKNDVSPSAPSEDGECRELTFSNVEVTAEENSPLLIKPESGEFCYTSTTTTSIIEVAPDAIIQPCFTSIPIPVSIKGDSGKFFLINSLDCNIEFDWSQVNSLLPLFLHSPLIKIKDKLTSWVVILPIPNFLFGSTEAVPFEIKCHGNVYAKGNLEVTSYNCF